MAEKNYKQAKVIRVFSSPKKDTGEIINYIEIEVLRTERLRLPTDAKKISQYESLQGKEAMIPCEIRSYEGRSYLALTEHDPQPIVNR